MLLEVDGAITRMYGILGLYKSDGILCSAHLRAW